MVTAQQTPITSTSLITQEQAEAMETQLDTISMLLVLGLMFGMIAMMNSTIKEEG